MRAIPVLSLLIATLLLSPGNSRAVVDCTRTIAAWNADKSLRGYMSTHTCICPSEDAQPVCTKNMIAAPSTGGSGGKQDFQKQMINNIFPLLFNSIFSTGSPQNNSGDSNKEELQRQEEEKMKREAIEREAIERWKTLQKEEAERGAREAERKQKAGRDLLKKIGSADGDASTRLKWEKGGKSGLAFQPVGSKGYPTAKFSELQRLLCASYFSSSALNAKGGDGGDVQAKFLNEQADKVMAGQPTSLECRFPDVPQPPDPKNADAGMEKILSGLNKEVKLLQEAEDKLYDVKMRVKKAESKKESATTALNKAQNEAQNLTSNAKPEEKTDAVTPLDEALASLRDAEKELSDAKELENKLIEEKGKIENNIKNINKELNLQQ